MALQPGRPPGCSYSESAAEGRRAFPRPGCADGGRIVDCGVFFFFKDKLSNAI